jgi:hypothetical protein
VVTPLFFKFVKRKTMSAEVKDCYDLIIGLSRTECSSCYTIPVDANVSKSGLYMDEAEGMTLDMAKASADCEKGNIWQIMDRARTEAVKAFKRDLLAAIGMKAKLKRSSWRGSLGDIKSTGLIQLNTLLAGNTVLCANIRSGIMTLKRIGCSFTTTENFEIRAYNNVEGDPIKSFNVSSQGNGIKWNEIEETVFPMSLMGLSNLQYWFVYTKGSLVPNNVKSSCGCNGTFEPIWSPNNPVYNWDGSDERYRWSEFVQIAGAKGNDISQRENTWSTTVELNGILLDVEFSCNVEETICKENFNFAGNPLAIVMANAIRCWANAYLMDAILSSKMINRYTLMSEEKIMGLRNRFRKEYNERINNYLAIEIVENYLNSLSDCFECKDEYGFEKVGIFS